MDIRDTLYEEHDLLGAKNIIRVLIEVLVEKTVKEGRWFSFGHVIDDAQEDLASFKNDKGVKLGNILAEAYPETPYRCAVYKYLMRAYLCYMEVPALKKNFNSGGMAPSFNKVLVTSNLEVAAKWVGEDLEEVKKKYGSRIEEADYDNEEGFFPYLKLTEDKSGVRKITRPRGDIDLLEQGTRVIPLFALKKGVDMLYDMAKIDCVKVTFYKDGGQLREITTTFDDAIVRKYYGSSDFYFKGVEGWYQGDFVKNRTLGRGYVRVIELGGSKYDNPLRSINYARIISIETGVEPDTSFINIDLNSVVESFKKGVQKHYKEFREIVDMLEIMQVGSTRKYGNGVEIGSADMLEIWADNQSNILSTVFHRSLALFMLGNPQWFEDYTGEPVGEFSSMSSDFGLL